MLESYSENLNLSLKGENYTSENSRFLFLHTPVAMCMVLKDTNVVDCINPAFSSWMNLKEHDILGKNIFDFFGEESKFSLKFLLESSLLEEYPACKIYPEIPVTLVNVRRQFFVNIQLQPILTNSDSHDGLLLTFIDVTAAVQLKKRLEEDEQRLKLALETSKIGAWEIDLVTKRSVSSYWHQNILNPKGKTGDWSFEAFLDKVIPADQDRARKAVEKSFKTNYLDYKVRIYNDDKTISWVHIKGQILRNNQLEPIRIIGTIMDVSESQEIAQKKDELISIVSHELKTPVTSLKGFAQALERKFGKAGDTVAAVMLKKMVLQIVRLTALIHDILDTSHIDSDKVVLKSTRYLFNELIDDIVREIESTVTHKIIVKDVQKILCCNDKEKTGQVISNLLSNAVKYSPGKERVIVEAKADDNQLIFSVSDFGLGIPVEKQQYIFERFYRVQEEQGYTISGLGLGLYISAEIIKRQGGKIWFTSKHGEGSTFYFSLPLNLDSL